MKKNSINAFEEKKVKLTNINGGGYFEGTYQGSSDTRSDSHYVTEKGETNQVGETAGYDQYDAELCEYGLAMN